MVLPKMKKKNKFRSSSLAQLRLILWKNLHMRLHYPVLAILEFLVPIIVFHLGLGFHQTFGNQVIKNTTIFPSLHQTVLFEPFNDSSTTIMYTPLNEFTTAIMNNIRYLINITELIPVSKETTLEALFSNQTFVDERRYRKNWKGYGIVFSSNKDDEVFQYTIRALNFLLKKDTRELFSADFAVATDKEDEYLTTGFLGLQFALDKAYIQMRSNENKNSDFFDIRIQKFPYPEYLVEWFPENIIYFMTLVGFVFLALTVPHYIAIERHTGMKELMKMMGMQEWMIWFGWITYSLMIYPFVIAVIVVILKTNISADPFYRNIDSVLIWMIFMLYCIANMTFLFAIGTLVNKHWVAIVASVVICFVTSSHWLTAITYEYEEGELKILAFLLLCFIPNLVLYNAFKAFQYFELKGTHTDWSSIVTDIMDPQVLHLRTILLYFVLNIILNGIVIMYVSAIHPGRYGRSKSPLFIFNWIKWFFLRKPSPLILCNIGIENEYTESIGNETIGIQLCNIQKSFGFLEPFFALKDIHLNIVKGNITVLLGHNGAGKTTLLNIISGMLEKTSGDIYYIEDGIVKSRDYLEGKLGFCSQQDIYFNYLSVEEHILFCAMLRGYNEYKAIKECHYFLNVLSMQEKATSLVHELSGGMKKKLALAMALVARPEVIVLDEPTSGMDVQSRRMTWDLLKRLKDNRIIVITTQDMEEADIIGDRIAIMHDSQIFCYGSPKFLKSVFGTGYNLLLTKGKDYDSESISKIIKEHIPTASLLKDTAESAKYNLPLRSAHVFSDLFSTLEQKLQELHITNIHVSCTTMDQVFINVSFLAGKDPDKTIATQEMKTRIPVEIESDFVLIFNQIKALYMKKFRLSYRRYIRFFSCIALALFLGLTNIKIIDWTYLILYNMILPPLNLSISTYPNAEVFVFYQGKSPTKFANLYVEFIATKKGHLVGSRSDANVTEGLLEFSKYNLYEFRDNVVAAVEITDNGHNVLYNELIPHSAPISLNTYTNTLLRYLTGNKKYAIETINYPISVLKIDTFCSNTLMTAYVVSAFWWVFIFNSGLMALFVYFISIIISERIHGIKHIQTMTRLSEFTYWLGNFVYDYSIFLILSSVVLGLMRITDGYGVFTYADMKTLLIIFVLFGISGLLYSYVFATIFDSISVYLLINIIINICFTSTLLAYQIKGSAFYYIIKFITVFLPPFAFLNVLTRYLYVLINNNHCVYCLEWEIPTCIDQRKEISFLDANPTNSKFPDSSLQFIEFMILDILIYFILLIFFNSNFFLENCSRTKNVFFGIEPVFEGKDIVKENTMVKSEKNYVRSIFKDGKTNNHALVVHELQKNFIIGFHKFTPVADVNFHVGRGVCFGVVGLNGAGKSTIFKVLTADIYPTKGDAMVYNIKLSKNRKQYSSLIGYCPQTNAVFEELTAKEMLHLFATLRGLKNANLHVDNWITTLDMERYQDNLIETYSTGNKRKLCTAISLIGDPHVVFLDEPTTGIDPFARQLLFKIVKSRKLMGQSIVISSHSLKECEILCEKVTIMRAGTIRMIGTIASLKKEYAIGYTLQIKLRKSFFDFNEKIAPLIDDVINEFKNHCYLKDKRVGLLLFRIIDDKILWSELFGTMEKIKVSHDVIDEYTITNTTVEEIFISSVDTFFD